jgi:hypothetical protein
LPANGSATGWVTKEFGWRSNTGVAGPPSVTKLLMENFKTCGAPCGVAQSRSLSAYLVMVTV